jgi:enediyne biosynthesis protein E4
MKTTLCSALCLTLIGAGALLAQPAYLTRILDGDIANDAGNFWGCAWGDYDNDGNVDLFVCNTPTNRLYRNNGNGTFTRITTGKIVNDQLDPDAPVWGDYDNDGDLDLFVTSWYAPARDCFYRNDGNGTFTRITQGAWVNDSGLGVGAAWGDYDADGLLDLYVANSQVQNDFLYHNNGDGTMTRITTGPIPSSGGSSTGCSWADYDGDGYLDLFVANTAELNQPAQNEFQFHNNGDGTFTRITTGAPVNDGGTSSGIAWGDYDNDGDLDLFVTDSLGENDRLYRNDGTDGFLRITEGAIVSDGGSSMSAAWGDYDNDGYLDLFVANDFGEDNCLYHNEGDGTFSKVTEGGVVNDGGRSWSCAWADFNNDGFLDLFVANGGYDGSPLPPPEPSFLYRNDTRANGNTNGWLLVRLVGTASNRSAIGTKVRVQATIRGQSLRQLREISGGSGWCSQNDLRAHFGLGDATTVATLRIEWPSGIVQTLTNVAPNQILTITEHQADATDAPSLTVTKPATGPVQLTATGQTNLRYVFETSSDLGQWTKIAVRTNLTGTVDFTPAASSSPHRFYRVQVP